MKTAWTDHLITEEEKKKFEDSIRHSRWILDRQTAILDKVEKGKLRVERSPKAYDDLNWEYRQAHLNGYLQCLNEIKDLNNLDQRNI